MFQRCLVDFVAAVVAFGDHERSEVVLLILLGVLMVHAVFFRHVNEHGA